MAPLNQLDGWFPSLGFKNRGWTWCGQGEGGWHVETSLGLLRGEGKAETNRARSMRILPKSTLLSLRGWALDSLCKKKMAS